MKKLMLLLILTMQTYGMQNGNGLNNLLIEKCKNNSSVEDVQLLVDTGAHVNCSSLERVHENSWIKKTPLIIAIENGNLKLVQALLMNGACVRIPRFVYTSSFKTYSNNAHVYLEDSLYLALDNYEKARHYRYQDVKDRFIIYRLIYTAWGLKQ